MQFFRCSLPIDPHRLQLRFLNVLERHELALAPAVADSLFAGLVAFATDSDCGLACPFPLVSCVKNAHRHAKKIKAALGGPGAKLGKCQQVLAEFYGFGKWDWFTAALEESIRRH